MKKPLGIVKQFTLDVSTNNWQYFDHWYLKFMMEKFDISFDILFLYSKIKVRLHQEILMLKIMRDYVTTTLPPLTNSKTSKCNMK
ncbi:hypothetical protein [Candidatus Nitrosocosmicus sp. R]